MFIRYALRRLLLPGIVFFGLQLLLRIIFLGWQFGDIDAPASNVLAAFGVGALFDLAVLCFALIPYWLYLALLPARMHLGRVDRMLAHILYFVTVYALLFGVVAEITFWEEFNLRFNFIAVDYLVYTNEVLGNIWESYPVSTLLLIIAAVSGVIYIFTRRFLLPETAPVITWHARLAGLTACVALPLLAFQLVDVRMAEVSDNAYVNEIAANGVFNLFHAFRNNEIDYAKLYLNEEQPEVQQDIRNLMHEPHMPFVGNLPDDTTRLVEAHGPEQHKNVILVVMESMSADYMAHFGNTKGLTPNLDALADESLFFTRLYATGTRTVRGLEAVALSIPPTPGQSILRRPGNENLFSLGFIFKDRGYDTRFIYGGYGYFDNMNYFFSQNGFDVIDRTQFDTNNITHSNVWGVCDEDLFDQVIREANISYAAGKPFMQMVMTTSNHRPYTYPAGKIDIASPGGRSGGVKYADYAVGEFIRKAKTQPWFNDTVFVFVADHTAGSAGKAELTPDKYHIPLIYYAPGLIQPQRYEHVASQIDVGPVLLGQLNFSYYTKFFGEDVMHDDNEVPHAFISNYQKVALLREDKLMILAPARQAREYTLGQEAPSQTMDDQLFHDTIAYYQYASEWKRLYGRIPTLAPAHFSGMPPKTDVIQ